MSGKLPLFEHIQTKKLKKKGGSEKKNPRNFPRPLKPWPGPFHGLGRLQELHDFGVPRFRINGKKKVADLNFGSMFAV